MTRSHLPGCNERRGRRKPRRATVFATKCSHKPDSFARMGNEMGRRLRPKRILETERKQVHPRRDTDQSVEEFKARCAPHHSAAHAANKIEAAALEAG